jgi:hypothetical protein
MDDNDWTLTSEGSPEDSRVVLGFWPAWIEGTSQGVQATAFYFKGMWFDDMVAKVHAENSCLPPTHWKPLGAAPAVLVPHPNHLPAKQVATIKRSRPVLRVVKA